MNRRSDKTIIWQVWQPFLAFAPMAFTLPAISVAVRINKDVEKMCKKPANMMCNHCNCRYLYENVNLP
jgi:hypothetical protein